MKLRVISFALIAALFLAAPLVIDRYYLTLLVPFFGYAVALLGLNLLFGYGGLLSFGHALFLAVGAYTAAVVTTKYGIMHFEIIALAVTLAAVAIAVPLGIICVRHTKIFFGMLTLAFGMLFHSFLFKFYELTGGDEGAPIRRPSLLGFDFPSMDKIQFVTGPFYYYSLALAVIAGFVMWRLVNSPFGLHLKAARDNDRKAEYVGVSVNRVRLVAFVVSAVYGAIGGLIIGINTGLADPEIAYWTQSGNLVFMTVLGGFSNFFGPAVGAFVFIFLQDFLASHMNYWRFVLGVVLAVIVIGLPRGIVGLAAGVLSAKSRSRKKMEEARV
ncbi:branched-chain amino acid ABC transporter permease [Bradyrhizobium ottawaense]|uniref:branched-chain amino acid ABC transporter permease n=1 Tax=Bradyrhizobium ottawaense TaxID=931866 RepID=UPI0004097CFA|nr:branched-chain amino acid ABC transporter permease [Bradyrhizobium ottawaense]